jgi:hypothetical protein
MNNRSRPTHSTRAQRARREALKRAFVWVFILLFTFTVAGGLVAAVVAR